MTDHCCIHEHDVVAAVLSRRWDAADDELKQHAADCEICRDVVAVARPAVGRSGTMRDTRCTCPAAGQVWWRAAVRARLEAAHAAARPMTWLHGIAGACALGAGVCADRHGVAVASRDGGVVRARRSVSIHGVGDVAAFVTAAMQQSLPLAFVVAACLVLAPVALYFVLTDD